MGSACVSQSKRLDIQLSCVLAGLSESVLLVQYQKQHRTRNTGSVADSKSQFEYIYLWFKNVSKEPICTLLAAVLLLKAGSLSTVCRHPNRGIGA